MEVFYERWNGAGDLLDVVDNRDGCYNAFFENPRQKCLLMSASGANGLMEIRLPTDCSAGSGDFEYHVAYHDGAGQCGPIPIVGNGSRCTVGYACEYGIVPEEKHKNFNFTTGDGGHSASAIIDATEPGKHDVTISMGDIYGVSSVDGNPNEWFVNSGTAHFVKFVVSGMLDTLDIMADGKKLGEKMSYLGKPIGLLVMVNFAEEREDGIHARCFDTSLGNEIQACGTGSMAMAVMHAVKNGERDGRHVKSVHWQNASIDVGYTKKGNDFNGNSLRSLVYRDLKGSYMADLKVQ